MKIAVLGSTGLMGAKAVRELESRGHEVAGLHRSNGADALTGAGLREAFAGVDAVVDCLNRMSLSPRASTAYFSATAHNVSAAARGAGVGRIVCLSIAGASDPAVYRWFGHYRGKAAQEAAYLSAGAPVAFVRSAQWFEFPALLAGMTAVGPLALLPTMRVAPVASDTVARLLADTATAEAPAGAVSVRGPRVGTVASFAREQLRACGRLGETGVRAVVQAPYLGPGIACGGLVPHGGIVDDARFEVWLNR